MGNLGSLLLVIKQNNNFQGKKALSFFFIILNFLIYILVKIIMHEFRFQQVARTFNPHKF